MPSIGSGCSASIRPVTRLILALASLYSSVSESESLEYWLLLEFLLPFNRPRAANSPAALPYPVYLTNRLTVKGTQRKGFLSVSLYRWNILQLFRQYFDVYFWKVFLVLPYWFHSLFKPSSSSKLLQGHENILCSLWGRPLLCCRTHQRREERKSLNVWTTGTLQHYQSNSVDGML